PRSACCGAARSTRSPSAPGPSAPSPTSRSRTGLVLGRRGGSTARKDAQGPTMSRKGSMPSEGESGRPRPPWRLRDVYDLLEQVRARPLMWLRSRSLRELRTLLTGYHLALCVHGAGEDFAFGP